MRVTSQKSTKYSTAWAGTTQSSSAAAETAASESVAVDGRTSRGETALGPISWSRHLGGREAGSEGGEWTKEREGGRQGGRKTERTIFYACQHGRRRREQRRGLAGSSPGRARRSVRFYTSPPLHLPNPRENKQTASSNVRSLQFETDILALILVNKSANLSIPVERNPL